MNISADSPLERYAVEGPESFGEIDLLALVLGGPGAEGLALALLERFGGPDGLASAPVAALAQVPGVGPRGAVRVHAACQLARRGRRSRGRYARTPEEAAHSLRGVVEGLPHEEAHGLFLNTRGRILALRRISSGSDRLTVLDPRQVLRPAVELGAMAVVLAHNHPSGDPTPSHEDLSITRRIAAAADVLGVQLADHLIFGEDSYVSMAELGILPEWGGPVSVLVG